MIAQAEQPVAKSPPNVKVDLVSPLMSNSTPPNFEDEFLEMEN